MYNYIITTLQSSLLTYSMRNLGEKREFPFVGTALDNLAHDHWVAEADILKASDFPRECREIAIFVEVHHPVHPPFEHSIHTLGS